MTDTRRSGGEGTTTVMWWIGWIVLTIASFFLCAYFWTQFIAEHVGPMSRSGVPVIWVAAVFGSWMVLLVPLIVVMYNKVDRAYEDARLARESAPAKKVAAKTDYRIASSTQADRMLSEDLREKLKKMPQALRGGHLVTAVLVDGTTVPHVFIKDRREIAGIYNVERMVFSAKDIRELLPSDLDKNAPLEIEKWLRLDIAAGE